MKENLKSLSLLAGVVLVISCIHFLFPSGEEEEEPGNAKPRKMERASLKRGSVKPVKARPRRKSAVDEKDSSTEGKITTKTKERPSLDDLDESELTKLQKAVLDELIKAFKDNDLKGVRKAIARFRMSKREGGLEGDVPKVIRKHAVTALGWFGGDSIGDMVEFMADIDPEIEEDAFAQFELILDDWDVSDRERSAALLSVLSALHDPDRVDSLLMALNNMRNSVKGETIIGILKSGTTEAKAVMQEQIELYTDFDITGADGISKWIKDNPDNEWDEEFYGKAKD